MEHNWLEMPSIKTNYTEFDIELRRLLSNPEIIKKLNNNTCKQLYDREEDILTGWETILPVSREF